MEQSNVVIVQPIETQTLPTFLAKAQANRTKFSDVNLQIGGGPPIAAHKVVLAAHSSVFDEMLASAGDTMDVEADNPKLFIDFIECLYTGKLALSAETAVQMYSLAEKYDIQSIKAACTEYIGPKITQETAFAILSRAQEFKSEPVIEEARLYVCDWFETMAKQPYFLELDIEVLKTILQSTELRVSSEEAVFEHALRWVEHRPERKESVKDVVPCIRYPFVNSDYLGKTVEPNQVFNASPETGLKAHLDVAFRFKSFGEEVRQNFIKKIENKKQFQPRIGLRVFGLASSPQMIIKEGGMKVDGTGIATLTQGSCVTAGRHIVSVHIHSSGGYNQFIGVLRASKAESLGNYLDLKQQGAWSLQDNGDLHQDGCTITSKRGWSIRKKVVTMLIDMDAHTLTFSSQGEKDMVLTHLPEDEAVLPAVGLYQNSAELCLAGVRSVQFPAESGAPPQNESAVFEGSQKQPAVLPSEAPRYKDKEAAVPQGEDTTF